MKALVELKNHVADISIEMAEKILKNKLEDKSQQEKFIQDAIKSKP